MIIPTLILSIIFIGIAFCITENNAKYLLSGYNTMSKEDKQKFDIHSFIPFFRNFHLFLGISLLIISLILYYFISPVWSGVFIVTYPFLAYVYFIWKGNIFLKEISKKQKNVSYIGMSIMFSVFIFIIFMFNNSLKDNQIIIKNNTIEITGDYGFLININDIKSIELINDLPEITSKENGFALEAIKKGYFKINNDEKVKLLINTNESPIILITTKKNKKIYYSSKNKSNKKIYFQINTVLNNKETSVIH